MFQGKNVIEWMSNPDHFQTVIIVGTHVALMKNNAQGTIICANIDLQEQLQNLT